MKKNLFLILFAVSVTGVITGIMLELKWMDYLFKPLIMISVSGHFLLNRQNLDKKTVTIALCAFLFSFFGDIFLMFSGKGMIFFMSGLFAFLIAQLSYIFLFRHLQKQSGRLWFIKKKFYWLFVYLIYGVSVYILLYNHLDFILKIAVFVYMVAILGMSAMALNLYGNINSAGFYLLFTGSLLFVVSDTLIALNKFLAPIPNERLLVMSTYMAAQFLIMNGILRQSEKV